MIAIKITTVESGKNLRQLGSDFRKELTESRNKILEAIRQELLKEAPSKQKGNKWSENKIYNYLSNPKKCIRRKGWFEGSVVLDQRSLPHLKYVLKDRWGINGYIYPKGRALKICKPRLPKGRFNPSICGLYARVKGHAGNDFLLRAYIHSRKWVDYYSRKYIEASLVR